MKLFCVFEILALFLFLASLCSTRLLSIWCHPCLDPSLSTKERQGLCVDIISFNTCSYSAAFQMPTRFSTPPTSICLLPALCPHAYNYKAGGLTQRNLSLKRTDQLFSFIHPFNRMGLYFHYMNTQRHAYLLLLMLLLFSTIQARYSAEARPLSKLLEVAKEGGGKMVTERAMVGSRPPRCERRCITCGHCEPVQVPAVPQDRSGLKHLSTRITSRGDDSSNYKPMSWKCKCGDTILNP